MNQPENLYTPGCIRTVSGVYFDIANPSPDMVNIEDIAHALSMAPRFGGHLPVFFSVAQHCVMAAGYSEPRIRFDVLMHDASEGYLLDLPSPIKALIPEYKALEARIMRVLAGKFGFTYPISEEVHKIDREQLEWEWSRIMLQPKTTRTYWTQKKAKREFLKMFHSLRNT